MYEIKLIDWEDKEVVYKSRRQLLPLGYHYDHYQILSECGASIYVHPSSHKRIEIREIKE